METSVLNFDGAIAYALSCTKQEGLTLLIEGTGPCRPSSSCLREGMYLCGCLVGPALAPLVHRNPELKFPYIVESQVAS